MYNVFRNIQAFGDEFLTLNIETVDNAFWADVLKHLKDFWHVCVPKCFGEFKSAPIHFNSCILRDKKVINLKSWIDNGILYVGILYSGDHYLTFNEFLEKYPVVDCNFLLYGGVLKAIKGYQRRLEIDNDDCHIDVPNIWQSLHKGGVKYIYWLLVDHANIQVKSFEKWTEEFNGEFDVNKIFTKIKKTTNDTSLRWFQYKIIYRILPTGRYLYLRNLSDSPQCTFCNVEEETLGHLFWDCVHVQYFWNQVQTWILENFMHCSNFAVSKVLVVFGIKHNVFTDRIIDLFMLQAKYQIFLAKINGTKPKFNAFLYSVRNRYGVERYRAKIDNAKFFEDWRLYADYFRTAEPLF